MDAFVSTAVLLGALATAVIYGSDVFAAVVLRPAAARSGDASLADLVGWIHHYGDRRLPVPFAVGLLAAGGGALFAGGVARVAAGVALVSLVAWLAIFLRVSAPVNRSLRAAAAAGTVPPGTRDLQRRWDSVLWARVALQGIALVGLLVAGTA